MSRVHNSTYFSEFSHEMKT